MRNNFRLIPACGALVCACALTAPGAAREEVSRDFQKTVPLAAGHSLRIENSLGNVTVHTGARQQVEIRATIRCSSDRLEEARAGCNRINISVDKSGAGVYVHSELPTETHYGGRNYLSWSINIDVVMPESSPLEVRNQFGGVSVTDLHAPAEIRNSNGTVSFTGGRGKQRLETSFGDINVARNEGDVTIVNTNGKVTASDVTGALEVRDNFGEIRITNVGRRLEVNSGNGNITVSGVGGAAVIGNSFGKVTVRDLKSDTTVRNQNGEVEATGVAGTADLRTSFGSVHFSQIGKGATVHAQNSQVTGDTVEGPVTAETTFGGIDVRGVKGGARLTGQNAGIRAADIAGEVYAKTSFGPVTLEDVAQPVTVDNQNGSVSVRVKPGTKCQNISLSTTFGPIRVAVPQGVGYDLAAHTTFGRISSEPPVTVTVSGPMGNDSISGKIAGGGCQLNLTDQNGNIDIVR